MENENLCEESALPGGGANENEIAEEGMLVGSKVKEIDDVAGYDLYDEENNLGEAESVESTSHHPDHVLIEEVPSLPRVPSALGPPFACASGRAPCALLPSVCYPPHVLNAPPPGADHSPPAQLPFGGATPPVSPG